MSQLPPPGSEKCSGSCLLRGLRLRLGVALLLAGTSGCIMFPVGTRTVTRQASNSTPIAARPKEIMFQLTKDNQLRLRTPADSLSASTETATRHRFVVVGIYPGMCANWCAGQLMGKTWSDDFGKVVFVIPIVNGVLCGLPTVIGWFSERNAEWEPPKDGDTRRLGTYASLVGWSKSSWEDVVADRPPASGQEFYALVSLPEVGVDRKVLPDKDGWFRVDPAILKPPAARPWALRIEMPTVQPTVRPVVVVLSADAFQ